MSSVHHPRPYKRYLIHPEDENVSKKTRRRWNKFLEHNRDVTNSRICGNRNGLQEKEDKKNLAHWKENQASTTDATNIESNIRVTNGDDSSSNLDSSRSIHSSYSSDGRENTVNMDHDESQNIENDSDEVLFPQSGFTNQDVLTMVVALTLKHRMTHEARQDILELIKLLGNLDDSFSTSNYSISKFFNNSDDHLNYIYFCRKCKSKMQGPLKKAEIKVKCMTCPNLKCKEVQVIGNKNDNLLISVDLKSQLVSILRDRNVRTSLITPSVKKDNSITDIHDGSIYQNLKKNRSIHFDLTYNFSTDGAPVFSSSKLSIWPIQCILNELPPKIRLKRLLFAGIWVGSGEPDVHLMNTFMETFALQAKTLFEDGITITTESSSVNFKLLPILCPCDSVARPLIQNRVKFNGYFGCSWCYQRGEIVGKQVKYPYRHEESGILRTKESYIRDLKEVANKQFQERVRGLKGPSAIIVKLQHFDPVWGFPHDYMHGVILGVVRQLWDIWTTYSPENRHTYYIGKPAMLKLLNQKLISITPPHEIHRLPRSIDERGKWKASEWRNWLLFYGLFCLKDVLKEVYLNHFALLVKAIWNLLQERISSTSLQESELLLKKFVSQFQDYYGNSSMTFNVHTMLHLTENVRKSGPLWATSTFPFESGLFTIKQQVKGPVAVVKQIAKKIYDVNTFLNNTNNNERINEKSKVFCSNLWSTIKLQYIQKCSEVTFLGQGSLLPRNELAYYLSFTNLNTGRDMDAFSYKRCLFKHILLHSADYIKATKTNDRVVQLETTSFVEIQTILVYDDKPYIFAKKLNARKLKIGETVLNHIYTTLPNENPQFILVPITEIKQKCILVGDKSSVAYICTFPNSYELNL